MLRRKGRWRKWLGLRGELWYYTDDTPDSPSRFTPSVLSALVALLSVAVSGYLGYSSMAISKGMLTLNRRTYLSRHPPKIEVRSKGLEGADQVAQPGSREQSIILEIQNQGDSKATNISITGSQSFVNFDVYAHPEIVGKIKDLNPLEMHEQRFGLAVSPQDFKKEESLSFRISIQFENEAGDPQPITEFCAWIRKYSVSECK